MSRHWAFTALVLSGLLVVSACSSGEPASHTVVRVGSVVHVGPFTQVFDSPLPSNPAQADVVEGFREAMVLWEKSENAQHLVPPVRDYVTGQALTHLAAAVKSGKTRDLVPAGIDRFFTTRVTSITGRHAVLATCDDGSKLKQENPRTGKVDVSFLPSPGLEYLFETWRMVQLSGHWAITAFTLATLPSRSAEPCQPGMAGTTLPPRPNVAVLLRQMRTAVRTASSVHISGTVQQGDKTLGANFSMTNSGEISGQISENGAEVTVLVTHGYSYLKLSPAFLRIAHLPATACSTFCGKYLKYPAVHSHQPFADLNMASMTRSLASTRAHHVKYLGVVRIAGQLAWLLQDSHRNSIYVAAHGKPYVLREVGAPPSENSVNLTQWNAVRIPGPPPASQVVNLSQLMR